VLKKTEGAAKMLAMYREWERNDKINMQWINSTQLILYSVQTTGWTTE
jgi:hypothetical protein